MRNEIADKHKIPTGLLLFDPSSNPHVPVKRTKLQSSHTTHAVPKHMSPKPLSYLETSPPVAGYYKRSSGTMYYKNTVGALFERGTIIDEWHG